MSLYLGSEIFDIYKHPLQGEFSHLFVRQGQWYAGGIGGVSHLAPPPCLRHRSPGPGGVQDQADVPTSLH